MGAVLPANKQHVNSELYTSIKRKFYKHLLNARGRGLLTKPKKGLVTKWSNEKEKRLVLILLKQVLK